MKKKESKVVKELKSRIKNMPFATDIITCPNCKKHIFINNEYSLKVLHQEAYREGLKDAKKIR